MHRQWEQVSTVRGGGRIEVVVSELQEGAVVKVVVSSEDGGGQQRMLGLLNGKVRMNSDFDAHLDEFDD
ncbi:MAG TPA: hypothetical protein VF669_10035 [Tepidisphaeraceae bacterium]|jgi:hypothetical protein